MKILKNISRKEKQFIQIYESTFDRVYRIFLATFSDEDLLNDALQEAYLRLWTDHLDLEEEEQDYSQLIYRYTRNYMAKERAKKMRRSILAAKNLNQDKFVDPDHEMDRNEYQNRIIKIVNELPEKCRHVYRLHKEEGLSYENIAERLLISTKTVDNHLQKAAKSLKKELQSAYGLTNIISVVMLCFVAF